MAAVIAGMARVGIGDPRAESDPAGRRRDRGKAEIAFPPEADVRVPEVPVPEAVAQASESGELGKGIVGMEEYPEGRARTGLHVSPAFCCGVAPGARSNRRPAAPRPGAG